MKKPLEFLSRGDFSFSSATTTPSPVVFSPLLFFLFQSFQRPLLHRIPLCQLKNQKSDRLVCNCFGIFEEEVTQFLQAHPQSQVTDITQSLFAGAACQSCLPELQKLANQWGAGTVVKARKEMVPTQHAHPYRKPYFFVVEGKSYSPYEFVLFVENEFKLLNTEWSDSSETRIYVEDLIEGEVKLALKGFSPEQVPEIKNSLILFFRQRLLLGLVLTFFVDGVDSP